MEHDRTALIPALSALADSGRLRMLRLLERAELSVGEIASALQLPQSTASRHLKTLMDSGWLSRRSVGTAHLHRLADDPLPEPLKGLWQSARAGLGHSVQLEEDDRRLSSVLAERARNAEAFFGRVGGEWDQIRTQLFGRAFTAEALAALADPSWTVADLGCGTGDAASLLAASVNKVIAVDREPAMLRAARKRLEDTENVDFHAADLESLPLETASVDVAFILLVLHHLEDPQKAVNEAARILKPKGTLVVVDMTPHERKEYRELMAHRHLGFSADQLKGWTKHCPLDLAHSRPLRPDPNAAGPGLFVARFSRRENA